MTFNALVSDFVRDNQMMFGIHDKSAMLFPFGIIVSKSEVMGYSPSLADKLALNSTMATIKELAAEFATVIKNA